ncbi:MAG TPA: hypothetical protein VET66_12365 [Steroidobacteraceae bacterium]|nr:hypothetical protein [Dehalococcoidia bacterium]HYM28936.1 hypothetical protein [Steroidobacteraceae bacterium]
MDDANCCVCEASFPPASGRPCRRCPDDWICSDVCLAHHRRTPWHRENQRAWAQGAGDEFADADRAGDLWRATVEVNRGLRRQLAEVQGALQVALAELHALRATPGGREGGARP